MKDKTRKIVIGSTIAAVGITGAAVMSHAITDYLMRVALDRQAPKSMVKSQEKMLILVLPLFGGLLYLMSRFQTSTTLFSDSVQTAKKRQLHCMLCPVTDWQKQKDKFPMK